MASVNIQGTINAPADEVWSIIADFVGVDKILDPQLVKSTAAAENDVEKNEVGSIRIITMANGAVIAEKLEWKNDASRRLIYTIVGDCFLPVTEYLAVTRVTAINSQQCQIDWQSTFSPIGPQEDAQKTIAAIYQAGLKKIQELTEGK